jgi:hypothetical protein
MQPVARVSIKYWKDLRTQQLLYHFIFFIFNFYFILYFRVCCFSAVCICCITTIFAYTCLLNGSVEYIVTTLDIFCVCEPPKDGRETGPKHVV